MNSLDYTTIKVVGVVEPHTNGIHAYLRVIGYIDPDTDGNSNVFIPMR